MDVIEELFMLDKELQHVVQRYYKAEYHGDPEVILSGSSVEVGTLC